MFRLFPLLFITACISVNASETTPDESLPEKAGVWKAESVEKVADTLSARIVKSSVTAQLNSKILSPQQQQKAKSLKRENRSSAGLDHLIWVYDAWLILRDDHDHDQYYHSFEITFDVDTSLNHADVYARLYLGDGEIFREFHTTSVFHIDALDVDDEFTVETELLEGFNPQDYDILIEIYDASDNRLEDSYDHNDDNDLYLIPLESREYDFRSGSSSGGQVVLSHEHGGSTGWFMLSLILITLISKYRRRFRAEKN